MIDHSDTYWFPPTHYSRFHLLKKRSLILILTTLERNLNFSNKIVESFDDSFIHHIYTDKGLRTRWKRKKKKKGKALNESNASVETSPTRGNAIDNRVRCHHAARYIRITMELTLGEATRGVALRTRASPLTAIFVPPLSLLVQDWIPPRDGRVSLPLSPSLSSSLSVALLPLPLQGCATTPA